MALADPPEGVVGDTNILYRLTGSTSVTVGAGTVVWYRYECLYELKVPIFISSAVNNFWGDVYRGPDRIGSYSYSNGSFVSLDVNPDSTEDPPELLPLPFATWTRRTLPRIGPPAIAVNGFLVRFSHRTMDGGDYYVGFKLANATQAQLVKIHRPAENESEHLHEVEAYPEISPSVRYNSEFGYFYDSYENPAYWAVAVFDGIIDGALDVRGSLFSFAGDGANPDTPAFSWEHAYGPVGGAATGNRLLWRTATPTYEWTWERPLGDGAWDKLMSLGSHPAPALRLSVPILVNNSSVLTASSAATALAGQFVGQTAHGINYGQNTSLRTGPGPKQIVLGTYNQTGTIDGVDHSMGLLIVGTGTGSSQAQRSNGLRILEDGTVLIRGTGDISMGEFTAGPQP